MYSVRRIVDAAAPGRRECLRCGEGCVALAVVRPDPAAAPRLALHCDGCSFVADVF